MTTKTSLASHASTIRARMGRKPWGAIVLFIGPTMLMYLLFIVYPLIMTLYYSLHEMVPFGYGQVAFNFVGFSNYTALFTDEIFGDAVVHTLIWGVVGPLLEMTTATALAFVVYYKVPLYRFYRIAWFMPRLVSGVIIGLVFKWVFNIDWGLLNVLLRTFGLGSLAINWLVDTPLWVVIVVHFWATFGYSFILLLAGLTTISEEVVEAAFIDGASRFQTVTNILLPILRPTFVTVLILSFMGKMRAFNVVKVLTDGGPLHRSETVATYVHKRAFGWGTLDIGYPAAMAVVWFGVVMVGVALINRWLSRQAEY